LGEAAKLAPQFGWLALGAALVYALLGPLLKTLEQHTIGKVGVAGFTIEFVTSQIEQAARAKSQEIPKGLRNRIERTSKGMFEVTILWLDDEPVVNTAARRALSSLGISVDLARTTEEAMELLADEKSNYAVIITDQNRKKESNAAPCFGGSSDRAQPLDDSGKPIANAGCYFVRQVKNHFDDPKSRDKKKMPPIVIYTSRLYPEWGIPTHAFGITLQVDELFHLILDALERRNES
jgi:CheY-like chemotaxis protein